MITNKIKSAFKHTGFVFASLLTVQFVTAQTESPYQGKIGKTLAESKEWWPEPTKAPKDAPNVIWILLDDVGFGASSAFGGLISTPTMDSLANNGLRYTNFHTTAICAPTRAALLTGRNSSYVHMAGFAHTILAAGFPGWDGKIPSSSGTIAEILKSNGYNTFAVGKYGVTPDAENNSAGPFDHWPSAKGFEHFFGFLGSQTDQYKPDLAEDDAKIEPDGRHFSEQITDKAIFYIKRQKKAAPNKPFFLYYSPGATHAPHQVPDEWRDIYKGKFDEGWDVYREKVFAQQKKLGVIPADAKLPERNPNIKAWNTLSADQKKLYARFMEVYAAFLTYTDHEIKRLIDELKALNQLGNTAIFVMIGDNGASKEGTLNGDVDRTLFVQKDDDEIFRHNLENIDKIGKPEGIEVNYPLGWAQACNTPFRFWKQDAQSEGGTRNPLIIFYPKKVTDKGGLRNQYSFITDILPTTLDIVGIKAPSAIKGIQQDTLQGISLAYSINNASAPSKRTQQYYYIFGSRSMYKDGWKAAYAYAPTLKNGLTTKYAVEDTLHNDWHLYDLNEDFNELTDLAKKYPQKLAELKALFDAEATKNRLYPLINWDDVVRKVMSATDAQRKAPRKQNDE